MALWEFIGRNAEQIVAILALLVATGGFWVQRAHNRLSVRPHLATFTQRNDEKRHVIGWLKNNGIGPALIRSFDYCLDKKLKPDGTSYSVDELLEERLKGIRCRWSRTKLGTDYSMPANESLPLLDLELLPEEPLTLKEVQERLEAIDLVVMYESFYGECFVLDTRSAPPSNQPLHPTTQTAEPPSSPGEHQR